MARARAVARLATDVDLLPARIESISRRVVLLRDVRRMRVGDHEVPVLRRACPVELVVVRDAIGRVKMKPALAALSLRTRIPGDRERLHASIRKIDQILLEREHAKRVLNGK